MPKIIKTHHKVAQQKFRGHSVPIIFSCDNNYAKYLSVAIQSIIDNSSDTINYDIVVLYTQISNKNINLIRTQTSHLSNFSCRFIDVTNIISDFNLEGKNHVSKETFYRLLILDLFKEYEKVIYLDCDLVVDDDIAKLFRMDISKYYLAACRDIIGIGSSHVPFNYVRRHQYNVLHLRNYHNYFNAGVLLMNLVLMRTKFTSGSMLNMANQKRFRWMDQDILNVLCENKTYLLDDKWNMTNHKDHYKEARHAPKEIYNEWKKSAIRPVICHFAGSKKLKPWFDPFDDSARVFWKYACKTPFYKIIVNDMVNQTKSKRKKEKMLKKIYEYINSNNSRKCALSI